MYKQFTLALLAAVATADEGDGISGPINGMDGLDHTTFDNTKFPGVTVDVA